MDVLVIKYKQQKTSPIVNWVNLIPTHMRDYSTAVKKGGHGVQRNPGRFIFITLHLTILIIHNRLNNSSGDLRNRKVNDLIQDEGKLRLKLFSSKCPADSLPSSHSVQTRC